jgi:hypothetical protein
VDVSEWEPATDAEVAMRDALRTDDQESYFRILSGVDLLLPVSADALAGLAPLGWGTWSTGGRTHVLAFTSSAALQACLADYTGSARRAPYAELANSWPNLEWWLAVNPGLPIEGYLPAWFVAQLSRGDLRLPTRGPGRNQNAAGAKIQDLHAAAVAANAAAAQKDEAAQPGGPTGPEALPVRGGGYPHYPVSAPPVGLAPQAGPQPASAQPYDGQQPASAPPYGGQQPASAPPYGGQQLPSAPPYGGQQPASVSPYGGQQLPPALQPFSAPPFGGQQLPAAQASAQPSSAPPYGSQTPLPTAQPAAMQTPAPEPASALPVSYGHQPPVGPPPAYPHQAPTASYPIQRPSTAPASAAPASSPTSAQPQVGPGGLPIRTPGGVMPSGLPARSPAPAAQTSSPPAQALPAQALPAQLPPAPASPAQVPSAYRPPAVPGVSSESRAALQNPTGPLPVRTPMAQTPPIPEHITPQEPEEAPFNPGWSGQQEPELPRRTAAASDSVSGGFPQGPASPQAAAAQHSPAAPSTSVQQGPGFGSPLPRRQAATSAEQSALTSSFPAFQTGGANRAEAGPPVSRAEAGPPVSRAEAGAPAQAPRAGVAPPTPRAEVNPLARPPVVPGAPGSDRLARMGAQAPLEVRSAPPVPPPQEPAFVPANDVERELYDAAHGGSTDGFLSTLLLATVLVPVANHSRPGSSPGESGFAFRTEQMDGEQFLIVFTSKDRLAEHYSEPTRTVGVRFYELIRNWPDPLWSFAVNPGGPVGAKYPGPQVIALASWAAEAGLGADPVEPQPEPTSPVPAPKPASDDAQHATVMQKTLPPDQVDFYLDRGYDRVAGFVHRATEVEHLHTPAELFAALGFSYDTSPHQSDAKEAYVLRWPAYRPSLYRIPYGGQNEQALRAMDGWVIERAPFRGNGFAPGEGRDVIAEFKVDSVRLPQGSQLWRMDADGTERVIAIFDNDGPTWHRVGEH